MIRNAASSSGQSSINGVRPASRDGLTLRQAALIAGFAYLMPVSYAEFSIWPKLVIPGHIEQTVLNISTHPRLFAVAIFCYLITYIEDVVIAWALYVLLAPVNRSLSLLTAWFRLVYTALALFAWLNLVTVYRLLTTPDYLTLFGSGPLHAQVQLLLRSFRYGSVSLVIFCIHLVLLGYLRYRSGYIPRIIGILLFYDGVGWVVVSLQPYLFPDAHVFGFFFKTSFVELLLPLWLLIRGWKIREPIVESA